MLAKTERFDTEEDSAMEICATLRNAAIFRDLDHSTYVQLGNRSRLLRFERGGQIFAQGERCADVYYLVSGLVRCETERRSGSGKRLVLDCVSPGSLIGVESLLNGNGYPHCAVSDCASSLVAIPVMRFLGLLREEPGFSAQVMATLSGRICRLLADRAAFTTQTAQQRIANHLLDRFDADHAAQPVSGLPNRRADFASLLAITPETLCRALTKMRDSGLLGSAGHGLAVLDPDGLAAVAIGSQSTNKA